MIKKLKITKESTTKEIVKQLQDYNAKMDELLVLHSKTLEDLKIEFSKNIQIAIQNRDRTQMSEVRNMLKEIIPPIRQEADEYKKVLNKSLESILSEKQNKKWLKYQKQNNFQDLIPEEYRGEKSLSNFKDMNDFVKSYLSAQKIVGADKIPVPNKFATEDDWKAVFNKLGAPEKPEDYKYSFKEGEVDQELLSTFNQQAHKLGLLPQQAESLIKFYNDMNEGSSVQAEEKAAQTRIHTENELKKEFGPQYVKRLDQAKRLASSTLGNDFLENTLLIGGHCRFQG